MKNLSSSQLPPEVARYLGGPPPESKQFDFLLGNWDVRATRFADDGAPLVQYKAVWTAASLNGGRMIMDDFKALSPDGQPVSSFVTLRTYCEATQRWELTGLQAMHPALPMEWSGRFAQGEMMLEATGTGPSGIAVKTRIRFFSITSAAFCWESFVSVDEGNSWRKGAELTAVRLSMDAQLRS